MTYSVFANPGFGGKPRAVVNGLDKLSAIRVSEAMEKETGEKYSWGTDVSVSESGKTAFSIIRLGCCDIMRSWRTAT